MAAIRNGDGVLQEDKTDEISKSRAVVKSTSKVNRRMAFFILSSNFCGIDFCLKDFLSNFLDLHLCS